MHLHKICIILMWFGLATTNMAAQSIFTDQKKWEFSIFAGGGGLGGNTFETPVQGEDPHLVTLDAKGGYVYGVRITENRTRYWGAELEYSLANHPLALLDLQPNSGRLDLDQLVHRISYSLLLNPQIPLPRVQPFALVGAGASLFQLGGDSEQKAAAQDVDLKNRWKLAFSYGGGIKLHVSPNWGFRLDLRDQVTGIPDYGLPSEAAILDGRQSPALRPDGLFHNWQFNIGLAYRFDRSVIANSPSSRNTSMETG